MNTTSDPLLPVPEPNGRRTGKIARLPKEARDTINQMILDGRTYKEVIQALGPSGNDINEDNLSNWKLGGYQDWLRLQQRVDQQQANFEMALDLVRQNAGLTIQKAARQIVAAQICQLLLDFDPTAVAAAILENPELYTRLINALARLSEGESVTDYRKVLEIQIRARIEAQRSAESPKAVSAETLKAIAQKLKLLPS